MDASTLKALLRQARAAAAADPAAAGGPTVLDRLLQQHADEDGICAALSEHLGIPTLRDAAQAAERLHWPVMAPQTAQALRCIPLLLDGESEPRIGVADPWDEAQLRRISAALRVVPGVAAVTGAVLSACLDAMHQASPSRTPDGGIAAPAEDTAVALVDGAIEQALAVAASDIHFECDRAGICVKLRQDGVMTPWRTLRDVQRAEETISRIKVLAQLDITERRVPQDGRFRWQLRQAPRGGQAAAIDLRVSIMPSIHGEDAVLRLLDKAQLRQAQRAVTLDVLGFDGQQAHRIRELAALPHGMLLVTGPTGSGKTTTVYAALAEINSGLEKIVTIEDPVEYELPGVLQIPVNERKGLTFAKGLRSILRHDPDRILVGEIRDAETAEIAVQSALTGHQVFTTVHANSIFDVVGRFRHFGLDMFGFMSSLNGVVVQRLLRRLCPRCAERGATDAAQRDWLGRQIAGAAQPFDAGSAPRAVGCQDCRGTGYRGRMVVAEVHVVDDALRDLVTAGAAMSQMRELVERSGAASLSGQGAQLVASGATTIDEVRRVVGWL